MRLKQLNRPTKLRAAFCASFLTLATGLGLYGAELNSKSTDPDSSSAIPAEVSQEIAEIQRQLGGSIVQTPKSFSISPQPEDSKKIQSLRTAAEQLDTAAWSLESAELYHRADNLRALAQEYRLEARKLRSLQAQLPPKLVAPPVNQLRNRQK